MLRHIVRSVLVLTTAGLATFSFPPQRSQAATPTVSLEMPATVQLGQTFTVTLYLTGATEVAAFESEVDFDFNFVSYVPDSIQLGPFLGSTGRVAHCLTPIIAESYVHIGCVTNGPEPPAASGAGILATMQFTAIRPGLVQFFNTAPPCELATVLGVNILPITCLPGTITVLAPTPTATPIVVGGYSSFADASTLYAPTAVAGHGRWSCGTGAAALAVVAALGAAGWYVRRKRAA